MEITNKQIAKVRQIDQPIETVWWRWTTHEGLKTFFGVDNHIVLAPNGAFEIYFLKDNPYGLRGSEGCKVLSYVPERMFSFTWNAPPSYQAERDSAHRTWVVVEFDAIDQRTTKVTLTHLGWPNEGNWNLVYDYFNSAWEVVLDRLEP